VTRFLIDTNILSEFNRRDPEPRVIRWLEAADNESLHASALTLGEIRMEIELLPSVSALA
jgi:predicted nucleic acid-binding protein